jgi:hypothetical protein
MWASGSSCRLTAKAGILLCALLFFLSLSSCPPATSCKVMDGPSHDQVLYDSSAGDAMQQNSTFTAGGGPIEENSPPEEMEEDQNDTFFCHICNRPFRLFRQLLKHIWCAFTYQYADHLHITGTPVAADTPEDLIPFIRNLHLMSECAHVDHITDAQQLGVQITSTNISSGPGDRHRQENIEEAVAWTANDWRNDLARFDPLLDGNNRRRCVRSNCTSLKCDKPPTRGSSTSPSKRMKRSKRTKDSQINPAEGYYDDDELDCAQGYYDDDDAPDGDCFPLDPASQQVCQVCPLSLLASPWGSFPIIQ